MTKHRLLTLSSGDLRASVAPQAGGAISRFWQTTGDGDIDWLRAAGDDDISAGNPLGMACFPLLPFSNRIRDGRFEFDGKTVALPLNFGDHPHAIHGHGWQAPWQIIEQSASVLSIGYRHSADAWPWSYAARQRIVVSPTALSITISLRNDSDSDMPAGLGLHPYFPRTPNCRITAPVVQIWRVDDEVMPLSRQTPGTADNPNTGIEVDSMALDNGYTDWRQRAEISWPERKAQLTLTAKGPLTSLVIFTPPDEDFFCLEPVSHCTDAFNLAQAGDGDTGMAVIAPGETLSARVRFEPAYPA